MELDWVVLVQKRRTQLFEMKFDPSSAARPVVEVGRSGIAVAERAGFGEAVGSGQGTQCIAVVAVKLADPVAALESENLYIVVAAEQSGIL